MVSLQTFLLIIGIIFSIGLALHSLLFYNKKQVDELEYKDSYITFNNFLRFGTIFSLTGFLCLKNKLSILLTLEISSIVAFVFVILISLLFLGFKLHNSTPIDMKKSIGCTGTVRLTIPYKDHDFGKVNIIIDGEDKEMFAFADLDEVVTSIKTGTKVEVVDYINNFLIVKPI